MPRMASNPEARYVRYPTTKHSFYAKLRLGMDLIVWFWISLINFVHDCQRETSPNHWVLYLGCFCMNFAPLWNRNLFLKLWVQPDSPRRLKISIYFNTRPVNAETRVSATLSKCRSSVSHLRSAFQSCRVAILVNLRNPDATESPPSL